MSRRYAPIEETYFRWLCRPLDRQLSIHFDEDTLRVMHRTPFWSVVDNDRNRSLAGLRLREEFLYYNPDMENHPDANLWLAFDCSILEMMMALSKRLVYQAGGSTAGWMDTMMSNLGLPASPSETRRILRRLNERTYEPDGTGGLFPLSYPLEDQRDVEIWYQMSAYLIENYEGEGV